MTSRALQNRINRLTAQHPRIIDLSLERMTTLLCAMGNPHKQLAPVIHVAGTNGKGSTVAYLNACLRAGGYDVQLYRSPHLVRFNERIILNDTQISDDELIDALDFCAATAIPCTLFEIITAAAFHIFAKNPAHVLLLETGLGGRFDATNVIATPLATTITTIAIDHVGYLGASLRKIAREKAGIIKENVPLITAPQHPHVKRLLHAVAKRIKASHIHDNWRYGVTPKKENADTLSYTGTHYSGTYQAPSLYGQHQYENAATAIASLECVSHALPLSQSAINHGIGNTRWRGRMEKLTPAQLRLLDFDAKSECWLDGGHNPQAAGALKAEMEKMPPKETHILCGILSTKDVDGFLEPLSKMRARGGKNWHWHVVTIDDEPAAEPATALKMRLATKGIHAHAHASSHAALDALRKNLRAGHRLLICGSLYLIGKIYARLDLQAQSPSCSSTQAKSGVRGKAPTRVSLSAPL